MKGRGRMYFFVISLALYLLQNFANKQFSRTVNRSDVWVSLVQNGLCVLSAAAVLGAVGGVQILPGSLMGLAALFGVLYLVTVFALLKAFSLGPMGGSTLLCNIGMFISAIYGVLRFGDAFTPYIGLGAALLLVAVILSAPKDKAKKSGSLAWFAVALVSGLGNGTVASIKREAVAANPDATRHFLFWGFLFAAVAAALCLTLTRTGRSQLRVICRRPKLAACGVLAGVGTAGGNLFQMLALTRLPSTVVYPLTSGFLVVSLWLASYLLYRETKPTWKTILAVVCCVAAIVLINL